LADKIFHVTVWELRFWPMWSACQARGFCFPGVHISTHARTRTHIHRYTYMYVRTYVCAFMYVRMYARLYMYIRDYMCVIYIHMCTHKHTLSLSRARAPSLSRARARALSRTLTVVDICQFYLVANSYQVKFASFGVCVCVCLCERACVSE